MRDKAMLDEFRYYYGIDRELYTTLTRNLCRNPSESLQIMGTWLWFERAGFCHFISKILVLTPFMINILADEAVAFLKFINISSTLSYEAVEIPWTCRLVESVIYLQYLHRNRVTIYHDIQRFVSNVYIPALSDLMERARHGELGESPSRSPPSSLDSLARNLSSLTIGKDSSSSSSSSNDISWHARTVFATFSESHPVSENKIRQLLTELFGDCIESVHMEEVRGDENACYARIVLVGASFVKMILNGKSEAKYDVNGTAVYMRRYMERRGRQKVWCGCWILGPAICPHCT